MGGTTLVDRQQTRIAVASIVVLCLIAAMLIPAANHRAESYEVTDDPVLVVSGMTDEALAGRSVAFLDINNDGIGDMVVGAPGDSTEGLSSGKVMIYLGDGMETAPDIEITGSASERFGYSVALAGDVNSDGIDDLIVGAPRNDTNAQDAGVAYIILGAEDTDDLPERAFDADVVIEGTEDGGQLGYAVSTAGDVNQDSYDDVIVSAPFTGAGIVYMLYGGNPMDDTPVRSFEGSRSGDQFGFSLTGGMNIDGSAQPDVAVGAPMGSDGSGMVSVILNPVRFSPKVVELTGDSYGDRFGASVTITDFNGDVYGDLAVGAPGADSVGSVYMYYGSSMSGKFDEDRDVTFSVGAAGDMFGTSVASGEPQTDNIGDLLVGAPMNDSAGINAGRAYVFYGDMSVDSEPDVVVEGTEAGGMFGLCVASGWVDAADYDDDQAADFAVGAPNIGVKNTGAAYLYLGVRVIVPENPTVFGYVLDADSGDGLGNVLVTLASSAYSDSVRTTSNGSYGISSILSVPPGTYWINASCDGYFTGAEERTLTYDTVTNVSFEMDKLPVVQGVISDGNATGPLADALVEVRDDSSKLLDSMTTDSTGEYYFMLDALGAVTITVTKDHYFDGTIELTLECNDDIVEDLTLNHFPIVLFSAEDTAGDPINGVDVVVSIDGEALATGRTGASGETVIMVPGEGSAYINSTRVGYVPDATIEDLAANTMVPVDVVMETQPSISGTVSDAMYEAPVSGATVDLFVSGSTDLVDTATSNSRGYYVFDVVDEGTYDLRVTASGFMRQYRLAVEVVADEAAVEDFWLYYDVISPTSEISDPQPGLICLSAEVHVFANATDPNDNEILYVELWYSHEGGPYEEWGSDETGAPYMFLFNSSEADGDGIYEFYTIAYDCAGNMQTTPSANDTWVIVSSGAPESEVTDLEAYQTSDTFTVSATGTASIGVDYVELWCSYEGGDFEYYDQDDAEPYSWEFTAADGDGEYAFYSILVNSIGLTEPAPDDPDTSTFVDTADPTVMFSSPEDAGGLNSDEVTLEAEVTDDGSGLDYVTYQVDTGDPVEVEVVDGQAVCDVAATLTLEDGQHTIFVHAVDLAGNEATESVSFVVDTTDPSLEILSPSDGADVIGEDVTVEWDADDGSGSGIDTVEVRLDGGSWTTVSGDSHVFTGLDLGEHTVDVRATDNVGNTAVDSVTFTVLEQDATPPVVSITSPLNNSHVGSSSVTVVWSATDGDGSGIATVEIRLDAEEWATVTGSSLEFEALADGAHTVSMRVTDNSSNIATASVTFMVDTVNPTLTITSPADDLETRNTTVTVIWSCTDGGCGIDRSEVRIDGGAYVSVGLSTQREFADLAPGEHTVDVRAYDKAGNMAEESVVFTVTEKGGTSTILFIGAVLAVVVVAAVVVMLMRRKKAGSAPPGVVE